MSARLDIPRLRLTNQNLTTPAAHDAAEVVRRLGAVQAQDYAGAKWAIGMRAAGLTEADVERALDAGSIIRTHVLRPTWHMMAAEDARWILALTAPRVHAANAHPYRATGVDDAILRKASKTIEKALKEGKHLTRLELGAALNKAGIETASHPQRLAYFMMHAELNALICSGPRRGNQFTYALFDERVPVSKAMTREESLAELARRYFATRGPASVHDFSWWSGLTIADSKKAVALLGSELRSETIGEKTYWLSRDADVAERTKNAVHLLPNYDEYFIGFKDRSAILYVVKGFSLIPGNPMFTAHVVSLDGLLIGGWKRELSAKTVNVSFNLVSKPAPAVRRAIVAAAERYAKFLGLSADVSGHD